MSQPGEEQTWQLAAVRMITDSWLQVVECKSLIVAGGPVRGVGPFCVRTQEGGSRGPGARPACRVVSAGPGPRPGRL